MPYNFELRQEAVKEFTDAYNWYEEQKEGLVNLFKSKVYAKLKRICNNPSLYKKVLQKFL